MPCDPVSAVHGFIVPKYMRERDYKGYMGKLLRYADFNPWTKDV
jgi:hypothetical protein